MRRAFYYLTALDNLVRHFLSCLFKRNLISKNQEESTEKWVFILSPGRTGSTLFRKRLIMMGVGIPPESYDFIPKSIKWFAFHAFSSWSRKVEEVLKIFEFSAPQDHWNVDLNRIKKKLETTPKSEQSLYKIVSEIYQSFIDKHYKNAAYYGDKTPYLSIDLKWIRLLFPKSKYVSIIRNSRDTIDSRVKHLKESKEVARDRLKWSIKEIVKHKKKVAPFPEFTLENFSRNHPELITYIFNQFEWTPEPIDKNAEVYLGDDDQLHHGQLKKEIQPTKIDLKSLDLLDDYFLKVYKKELEILDQINNQNIETNTPR